MKKIEYTGSVEKFVEEYDKVNHKIWNEAKGPITEVRSAIRDHYLVEQNYCCAYCQIEKKETHGLTWDVEHIIPKAKYPQFLFEPENLAISCKECNIPKDDTNVLTKNLPKNAAFPSTSGDYCIAHPHFDRYEDHIEIVIIEKKRVYRVKTEDKGRQTYIACNLIRFDYKFGEWDCFESALIGTFSKFLDKCPKDANPEEIKRMLGHMKFS